MAEVMEDRADARQRRRAAGRQGTRVAVRKQNRTIVLSDATWEKVGVAAGRQGVDRSAWLESLLSAALSYLVIQDRSRPAHEGVSASQADQVSNSGESLPVGEAVTPADGEDEGTRPGAGEGGEPSPPSPRKRRSHSPG